MNSRKGVTYNRRKRRHPVVLSVALLLAGCHSSSSPPKASVQITQVPVANSGGPVQMDFIAGKAEGAAPGQQIIIYARSGIWWIQPFANQPFTKVQPDATWRNSTHLGTEYAALLIEPGYHPSSKLSTLPTAGNGIVAVASVKGRAGSPVVSKTIHFSGYDWTVRSAGSDRGGEPNTYDPANAWVDEKGYLHLRMGQGGNGWSCAEVNLTRSLGYGTYTWVVQDTGHLGPSAVLGLYTTDDYRMDDVRAELDIELSRWGASLNKNAQYVVQPFYIPENVSRFVAPAGVLTHTLRWEPGSASFKTIAGRLTDHGGKTVNEHVFTSGVPTPANETAHMDFYDYRHSKNPSQQPAEVVIEKFEYLP